MDNIGIIGYATPSPTGIVVRELRQQLGITKQLTIFDYDQGGHDFKWATGTWCNGFPKSGDPAGRWEWEVTQADLEAWVAQEKLKTVVFVGSSFGERSFGWAKALGLKVVFVGKEHPAGADVYVAVQPGLGKAGAIELPYPIVTEIDKELWANTLVPQ